MTRRKGLNKDRCTLFVIFCWKSCLLYHRLSDSAIQNGKPSFLTQRMSIWPNDPAWFTPYVVIMTCCNKTAQALPQSGVTTRSATIDLRAVCPRCVEKTPESNLFVCTDFLLSRLVGATDAATLLDGVSAGIAPGRLAQ